MAVERTSFIPIYGYGATGPSGYCCHGCGQPINNEESVCRMVNATDGRTNLWGRCCASDIPRRSGE